MNYAKKLQKKQKKLSIFINFIDFQVMNYGGQIQPKMSFPFVTLISTFGLPAELQFGVNSSISTHFHEKHSIHRVKTSKKCKYHSQNTKKSKKVKKVSFFLFFLPSPLYTAIKKVENIIVKTPDFTKKSKKVKKVSFFLFFLPSPPLYGH